MELIKDHAGSITVVTFPETTLDANNNQDFMEAMNLVVGQGAQIVFDMSRIHFMDSRGLGVIMLCWRRLNASDGTLKLCGLSKPVRDLFELVRLYKLFDIYKTREEAIEAFES